jgi:hypothetical protein
MIDAARATEPFANLMNPKIERLRAELKRLRAFSGEAHAIHEVTNWVGDCAALFTTIRVPDAIVQCFMETFRPSPSNELGAVIEIGPFKATRDGYKIQDGFLYDTVHANAIYIKVAFRTAANIIEELEEEESLVSSTLINLLQENTALNPITASLTALENNFQNRDAVGMTSNSIALLSSIFDLESTLKGRDLSKQIALVRCNDTLQKKFGIEKDVLYAIDNSRLIRNYKVSHKTLPIPYDIPLAVSLGSAHLILMVLFMTMAAGELIK